jgi:hypothetical protein
MIQRVGLSVLLFLSLGACSRSHERDVLDLRVPSNAQNHAGAGAQMEAQSDVRMTIGDGGAAPNVGNANAASDSGVGRGLSEPPVAEAPDRAPVAVAAPGENASEVWIGQLWWPLPDANLCTFGRPWNDPSNSLSATGNTQRVVLLLEHVGTDGLGGRIQLGKGTLPEGPPSNGSGGDDSDYYVSCSFAFPTTGVEYPLFDVERSPQRLRFSIAPTQAWDGWCATQTERPRCLGCAADRNICECSAGACRGATNLRVVFDLAITLNTIEGQVSSLGDLRLTRRR